MQLNYHYNLTIQLIFNPQLYLKQNITRFKQSILYESDIKAPRIKTIIISMHKLFSLWVMKLPLDGLY